jgi:hypothetical protein
MKKVLLTLIAAALVFACKKKEEVKPAEPPAAAQWNAYFKMGGNLNDSTNTLTGNATDVTSEPPRRPSTGPAPTQPFRPQAPSPPPTSFLSPFS